MNKNGYVLTSKTVLSLYRNVNLPPRGIKNMTSNVTLYRIVSLIQPDID